MPESPRGSGRDRADRLRDPRGAHGRRPSIAVGPLHALGASDGDPLLFHRGRFL